MSPVTEIQLLSRETHLKANSDLALPLLPSFFPHCYTALYQDLDAASPEDSDLPPGPFMQSPGFQKSEVFLASPKKVLATSGLPGVSSEEPGICKLQLKHELIIPLVCMDLKGHPELIVPVVPIDHHSISMASPESSSRTPSKQHSPASASSGRERVSTLPFETGPGN